MQRPEAGSSTCSRHETSGHPAPIDDSYAAEIEQGRRQGAFEAVEDFCFEVLPGVAGEAALDDALADLSALSAEAGELASLVVRDFREGLDDDQRARCDNLVGNAQSWCRTFAGVLVRQGKLKAAALARLGLAETEPEERDQSHREGLAARDDVVAAYRERAYFRTIAALFRLLPWRMRRRVSNAFAAQWEERPADNRALVSPKWYTRPLRTGSVRRRDLEPPDPPPAEECRSVSVTAFKSFYRIHSWAVYRACYLDPDGIDADHPADLDDEALGARAREALLASRFLPLDHPDWERVERFVIDMPDSELDDRLMARAGVTTKRSLYEWAANVSLDLADGVIRLDPGKYHGQGGFEGIRGVEPTELPETVSDEELGATIRVLVELSRRHWYA